MGQKYDALSADDKKLVDLIIEAERIKWRDAKTSRVIDISAPIGDPSDDMTVISVAAGAEEHVRHIKTISVDDTTGLQEMYANRPDFIAKNRALKHQLEETIRASGNTGRVR
ncbi:MAG: hypothetical protein ACK502_00240 [Alphaproteobacteria bacterium]